MPKDTPIRLRFDREAIVLPTLTADELIAIREIAAVLRLQVKLPAHLKWSLARLEDLLARAGTGP